MQNGGWEESGIEMQELIIPFKLHLLVNTSVLLDSIAEFKLCIHKLCIQEMAQERELAFGFFPALVAHGLIDDPFAFLRIICPQVFIWDKELQKAHNERKEKSAGIVSAFYLYQLEKQFKPSLWKIPLQIVIKDDGKQYWKVVPLGRRLAKEIVLLIASYLSFTESALNKLFERDKIKAVQNDQGKSVFFKPAPRKTSLQFSLINKK